MCLVQLAYQTYKSINANASAINITQVIITAQVHFSLTYAYNATLSPRAKQVPLLRTRPEKANGIAERSTMKKGVPCNEMGSF